MAKVTVTPANISSPQTVSRPQDMVDLVSTASLLYAVQPLTDNAEYLRKIVQDSGVKIIRQWANVSAMKATVAEVEGEIGYLRDVGLYVFVGGAGHEGTAGDNDPYWFRTSTTTAQMPDGGRWENVISPSTQARYAGTSPNTIPLIGADGRISVRGPMAIMQHVWVPEQTAHEGDIISAESTGFLYGTANISNLKSGDIVKVDATACMCTWSQLPSTFYIEMDLSAAGGTNKLIGKTKANVKNSVSTYTYQTVPILGEYTANIDYTGLIPIRVRCVPPASDAPLAYLTGLRVDVMRP